MYLPKFAKIIFATFLLSISFTSVFGQSGWNIVYYTTNQLRCLYFVNDQTGWAVGYSGNIIKTTDGGQNWTQYTANSSYYFQSVYFPSSNTGYAVGSNSLSNPSPIVKTTDGGTTWLDQSSGTFALLTSVYFISNDIGWVVGDSSDILSTTNGGNVWTKYASSGTNYYTGVRFVDANTGYIVGGTGLVVKTINGGVNWVIQSIDSVDLLLETRFPTPAIGYIVGGDPIHGSGIMFKTTNSGTNWTQLTIPQVGYIDYLSFVDENTGWVCGLDSTILHTADGGNTWTLEPTGFHTWITSIQFVNSMTGYASTFGGVLKTTSGGLIGIKPISNEVPKEFMLLQNFPNPFNPVTTIKFAIPKESNVKLTVYDLSGREIAVLVNENVESGKYQVSFDGGKYASGVYFYRLDARQAGSSSGSWTETKKMVLVK